MKQDKEALKEPAPDVDRSLVVTVSQDLSLVALQEVFRRLAALILVDLQRGLVRGEGDEVAAIGGELAQEAGRLLHIDHSEVGEDILVEDADLVPVGASFARADPAALQAVDDILVLDATGPDCGGIMVHGKSSTSSSPCQGESTYMPWDHRDRGTIQGTEGPACRGGVGESPNEPREQGGQLKSADVPLERGEMTQEDTGERGEKARRETSVGGTRENRGTQR